MPCIVHLCKDFESISENLPLLLLADFLPPDPVSFSALLSRPGDFPFSFLSPFLSSFSLDPLEPERLPEPDLQHGG